MRQAVVFLLASSGILLQAQQTLAPEVSILHTDRSGRDDADWADAVGLGGSYRINGANDIRLMAIKSFRTPSARLMSTGQAAYATRTRDYTALEFCYRHAIGGSWPWHAAIGAVVAGTSIREESMDTSQVPFSTKTNTLNGLNLAFYAAYFVGPHASVELQLGVRNSIGLSWRF
jgi:hypothetical protein